MAVREMVSYIHAQHYFTCHLFDSHFWQMLNSFFNWCDLTPFKDSAHKYNVNFKPVAHHRCAIHGTKHHIYVHFIIIIIKARRVDREKVCNIITCTKAASILSALLHVLCDKTLFATVASSSADFNVTFESFRS